MNKEWFVFKGTHHLGPFSLVEMEEFFRSGEITEQSLIWKEGSEKWEPVSKTKAFEFLFKPAIPEVPEVNDEIEEADIDEEMDDDDDELPPPFSIPALPKTPVEAITHHSTDHVELFNDDLPPPIPLDAIIDPKGQIKARVKTTAKTDKRKKLILAFSAAFFACIVLWYATTQREAAIQLRIKGLMPVYLEKLELTATKSSPHFEVGLALSLDSQTLWGSTNFSGDIETIIKLNSIPKKVLGLEDVAVTVKGQFINHLGKFNRMVLTSGTKFLPGEYKVHAEARETHFLNKHFKMLSSIEFFKSLNKTYTFDGSTLIYPGTPREFDKRLDEYSSTIVGEQLKPFQDKLERIQTFESILNQTSQIYLMELEKATTGKAISAFETKFMKEISPLLQSLVVKANELSQDPKFSSDENSVGVIAPFKEQVLLGKQIGEMASDMITKTESLKKLKDSDKNALRTEFDKRARGIKVQIDLNVKKLEEQIQKFSK